MQRPVNVKSRPRLPIPDEDPYSIAGNIRNDNSDSSGYSGGGGSSGNGAIIDATNTGNGKWNVLPLLHLLT